MVAFCTVVQKASEVPRSSFLVHSFPIGATMPLADQIRPSTLAEMAGQEHLLQTGAPLRRILESGHLPSMIFYGPPGTGKTTLANIAARLTEKQIFRINATTASLSDVKEVLQETDSLFSAGGILLYIDEIQYFNKKQQQALLEYVEDGRVTLICSTTENPYFALYGALLSRSTVFEFKPVSPKECLKTLKRGLEVLNSQSAIQKKCDDTLLLDIASGCGGDVRKSLTALENLYYASVGEEIEKDFANSLIQRSGMRFDVSGDMHYDLLSAFQKSIRGSDENAAVHYLARLLAGGDLLSPCRRLLVIAAEDIGLAYPQAMSMVKACVDSALQLGLPEAGLPLAEATILLATAPKSNSAAAAYWAAMEDVENGTAVSVPSHLQDTHYPGAQSLGRGGYKYPHAYPNNYVEQQYLPDELKEKVYYVHGSNKNESAVKEYWKKIKER